QVMCRAGETQIEKVLAHAAKETKLLKVSALVFVGDAMEENPDTLAQQASELGRLGVPAFMFQEGHDRKVEYAFREIAQLTHGAYARFNPNGATQLAGLLAGGGGFGAGGMAALGGQENGNGNKMVKSLGGLNFPG